MAESQKTKLEKVKLEAEAAKAHAEAKLAQAQAEMVVATAVKERIAADKAELEFTQQKEKRAKDLAADEWHHVYRFTETVGETSVAKCMGQLSQWSRNGGPCPIEIVFSSPGGAVIPGMALFDYIQSLRHQGFHVTTSALGWAASMAGILLQAGDHRVMSRESWLLIHEGSYGAIGNAGEVEDTVEWVKRIQGRILDIFVARSKLSKAQLKRRWHRRDWWISSDEALKYGFVDEVR